MDPLSSIANVASIAVILLSKLSEFVDSAKNAPAEVQRLNNELALLYSYLGRVKIVADAGINLTEEVKALLMKAIKDCETTMGTLQDLIDKSKKAETKRLLNQILKTVKFAWTEAEIKKIRAEILVEIDILDKIVKLSGLYCPLIPEEKFLLSRLGSMEMSCMNCLRSSVKSLTPFKRPKLVEKLWFSSNETILFLNMQHSFCKIEESLDLKQRVKKQSPKQQKINLERKDQKREATIFPTPLLGTFSRRYLRNNGKKVLHE